MPLTVDDVLIVGNVLRAFPLEHAGQPTVTNKTGAWWIDVDPIPEMWADLITEVSATLTEEAKKKAEDNRETLKLAAAGDAYALFIVKTARSFNKPMPTEWEPVEFKPRFSNRREGWCKACGADTLVIDRRTKFCSTRCQQAYTRVRIAQWSKNRPSRAMKEKRELVCVECGATFQAKRHDAKYCGAACRKRASRKSQS